LLYITGFWGIDALCVYGFVVIFATLGKLWFGVHTDIILGKEEIGDFVLVADGVLLDKLEYTLLRTSLYTRMRRRHCFKALKVDI
jgi:hypothetical protein